MQSFVIWLCLVGCCCGEWVPGTEQECREHLCTPVSNLTWRSGPPYASAQLCAALVGRIYRHISLYGDSFMRHLGLAMSMVLADRDNSSFSRKLSTCDGESVFDEKGCSIQAASSLPAANTLCRGLVTLGYSGDYHQAHCTDPTVMLIFSGGNHPTGEVWGGIDDTINNATAFSAFFKEESMICSVADIAVRNTTGCKIMFSSTHYSIDEFPMGPQKHEDVESFNLGMRAWVESGGCGTTTVFGDVYNMTKALVLGHFNESMRMTHDRMHWSRTVNMIKAHILIRQFLDKTAREGGHSPHNVLGFRLV